MDLLARLVAGAILTSACAFAASAQIPPGLPNPGLQNRIPAPLPPPPQPPVINGPLSQGSSQSGPGVYLPPRLNTFSDRASACAGAGSGQGLRGGRLDRYVRRCANAN